MVCLSLLWKESDMRNFLSRSLVLYCSMVSAYDNVHIRVNLPRLGEATKYAKSAGDRCVFRRPKSLYLGFNQAFQSICESRNILFRPDETVHRPTTYVMLLVHDRWFLIVQQLTSLLEWPKKCVCFYAILSHPN